MSGTAGQVVGAPVSGAEAVVARLEAAGWRVERLPSGVWSASRGERRVFGRYLKELDRFVSWNERR